MNSVADAARDAEQLNAIAELAREADIIERDVLDTFHQHVLEIRRRAEGEARQDRELVRRVAAADIERRISFGKTEILRFLQHLFEGTLRLLHVGEDIVASAVENAAHRNDTVRDQAFAKCFHDGDATGRRGLEFQCEAAIFGDRGEARTVVGEECLVGGDDMLPRHERCFDKRECHAFAAADQLDDDIRVRLHQRDGIGDPRKSGYVSSAFLLAVAGRHGDDLELALGTLGQIAAARMQRLQHTAADGADA
jgi:hypothetical protein